MSRMQWSSERQLLYCEGKIFDSARLEWNEVVDSFSDASLIDVRPDEALCRYAALSGLRRAPVAIIGPREASAHECDLAQKLGCAYARHGLQLICGGKNELWRPPVKAMSRGRFAYRNLAR